MYGDQRDRNVQTHSFPTRRSSDRQDRGARNRGSDKSLLALDEKQASDQPAHAMAEQQARGVGMVDLDQRQQLGHAVEIEMEEHTSELQSLMRNSYAVFCLKQKT